MASKHIFISAGELSGDIHGGNLIVALKKRQPELKLSAIGGDNMKAAGAELLYHIRETSFMGFAEVIKHLPFIYRLWKKTLAHIDRIRPDLVILIDYPGFNLRLAKAVTRRGIPVVYYISPQVWAWHQSRVKKIKKYTKTVICILPFEEQWLTDHGVNARFVGHPLVDQIYSYHLNNNTREPVKPANAFPFIGLFPGSRKQELHRHLPVMLDSVRSLKNQFPGLQIAVSVAPTIDITTFQNECHEKWIHWITNKNLQIMHEADLLIMSSGTATLEATLLHTPFVVIYRLSNMSYLMGKLLVKVPFISIANLIAGQKGVTELIQHEANIENIVNESKVLLQNTEIRHNQIQFLTDVSDKLGEPGASERAAELIFDVMQ